MMPTISLKVSHETAARLHRVAVRRRVAKSVVVREALDHELRQSPCGLSLLDLMKPSIGAIDSGMPDLGHNPKHLEGFGRK